MRKKTLWILPTLLVLFILQVITLPLVIKYTYSGRSESPDHTITYTTQKLKWDDKTTVSRNGSTKLSLFDTYYGDVNSGNGDHILAPGTNADNIIRLKNNTNRKIKYTAVVYEIRNQDNINATVSVHGNNFQDTKNYILPKNIKNETIIKAVNGSLEGNKIQDFNIDWNWDFEIDDEIDTQLGNQKPDNKDDIIVGFYLTVNDKGKDIEPQTGDNTVLSVYVLLMVVSATIMILMFISQRREKKEETNDEK